jgi:hypothetical protein
MKILDIIKFKNAKIKLGGTASLQAIKYFSDYDFTSVIKHYFKPKTICYEFVKILNEKMNGLYFIELKIEYKNGKKKKLFNISELKSSMFKNIDFVKIDYIVCYNNMFKELTIMYIFDKVKQSKDHTISQIQESYHELKDEGNYYKSLKRLYSIFKIKRNYKKLITLTKFFNSTGAKYEVVSNLKTIQILLEHYNDIMTKKKVLINLKDINVTYNDIEKTIAKFEKELNDQSKFYIV